MKKISLVLVALVVLGQVSHAARPVGAPDLCEIQIEAFEYQLSLARTAEEKEQVKKRWRNLKPSWRAACVKQRIKE